MTYIGNRGGIPIVTATLSEAGTADTVATYTLPNHTFRNAGNAGIILINFNTATAEATGVTLQVNNDLTHSVTTNNGDALTALTAGLHLLVFNKFTSTLNLIA